MTIKTRHTVVHTRPNVGRRETQWREEGVFPLTDMGVMLEVYYDNRLNVFNGVLELVILKGERGEED